MAHIYCIMGRLENDIVYVGKTKGTLKYRWQGHKRNKKLLIDRIMRENGIENYKMKPLLECKERELNQLEKEFISTMQPVYNINGKGE